jgi:hypothetical protein
MTLTLIEASEVVLGAALRDNMKMRIKENV